MDQNTPRPKPFVRRKSYSTLWSHNIEKSFRCLLPILNISMGRFVDVVWPVLNRRGGIFNGMGCVFLIGAGAFLRGSGVLHSGRVGSIPKQWPSRRYFQRFHKDVWPYNRGVGELWGIPNINNPLPTKRVTWISSTLQWVYTEYKDPIQDPNDEPRNP